MEFDVKIINQKRRPLVVRPSKVCEQNQSRSYANPEEQKKRFYNQKSKRLDVLA